MTCTIKLYAPTRATQVDPAVSALLGKLDADRPLANDLKFAKSARPWSNSAPVTCLVAHDDRDAPVGFLLGRMNVPGAADGLPGRVALVVLIGVLKDHGCTEPGEPTPGEMLIREFGNRAADTGAGHLVLTVGASAAEWENTTRFFARLGFVPPPGAESPDRLCLPLPHNPTNT